MRLPESMTNGRTGVTTEELIRQLKIASVQCDEMRLKNFGYLFKCAADEIERLKREVARNVLQKEWGIG